MIYDGSGKDQCGASGLLCTSNEEQPRVISASELGSVALS